MVCGWTMEGYLPSSPNSNLSLNPDSNQVLLFLHEAAYDIMEGRYSIFRTDLLSQLPFTANLPVQVIQAMAMNLSYQDSSLSGPPTSPHALGALMRCLCLQCKVLMLSY
mmetsp:Transcript_124918/g.216545  ORF Transcript_124918/g.216545 Transcript_124918/m.216545 type:complete len:109 (-) Transcript_124918:463-789(-)